MLRLCACCHVHSPSSLCCRSHTWLSCARACPQNCTQRLVARLDQAAAQGEVVKMHELAILTTLEVICQVGRAQGPAGVWCAAEREQGPFAEHGIHVCSRLGACSSAHAWFFRGSSARAAHVTLLPHPAAAGWFWRAREPAAGGRPLQPAVDELRGAGPPHCFLFGQCAAQQARQGTACKPWGEHGHPRAWLR